MYFSQREFCFNPLNHTYILLSQRNPNVALEDQCQDLPKATANACPIGNPIFPFTGQKIQTEQPDFRSLGPHPLVLQRVFRSDADWYGTSNGAIGSWTHNWQRRLALGLIADLSPTIMARRADGVAQRFVPAGQTWKQADRQSRDYIVEGPNEKGIGAWQYHVAATDSVEAYDATGMLLTVTERNGWETTLTYTTGATASAPGGNAGLLDTVRNQFGSILKFSYDSKNRVTAIDTPDGQRIQYGYDTNGTITVTWPDQTVRRYHYGEDIPNFSSYMPGRLTGITDELGVRYSKYSYNGSTGFVNSEEHAGGVEKLTLSYGTNATQVTDGNALTRSFSYQLSGRLRQPTGASGSSPIGDPFNTIQYDAGNNVSRTVDRNGSDTRYSYDAKGRETQRIDGYGTADSKTTTTEWHPTWNLPLRVAAPGLADTFTYDAKGQLIGHAWFPTNDINGSQGLNAIADGPVASTGWTYDANGLVTATVEKVGDGVTAQRAFTYDGLGNLATVTNGKGKIGTALRYDGAGRLLEGVDVNGVHSTYTYNQRGLLTAIDSDTYHIRYEYDAIGQRTAVIGPGDWITTYTYDTAHRLVQILDNLTITADSGEGGAGLNPFARESEANSISQSISTLWNTVIVWLRDWIASFIPAANAQTAPAGSTQINPPLHTGLGQPTSQPGIPGVELDPTLTAKDLRPGMLLIQAVVTPLAQACAASSEAVQAGLDAIRKAFDPREKCNSTVARDQAMAAAYAWAGISPTGEGATPFPWNNFNLPRGMSRSDKAYGDFMRRYYPPSYGYGTPDGAEVVEHPFGHPDLPGPEHHACPHFHATNVTGKTKIFAYRFDQ
jgi:YD repeat-containing protein